MTSAPSTNSRFSRKRGDPSDERDPAHRLDAADELVGLSDLLPLGAHHPDRRRPAERRLSRGASPEARKQQNAEEDRTKPLRTHARTLLVLRCSRNII